MSDNVHTPELLKEYQSYPLDVKILMTERRIHEYYTGYGSIGYGNAYVSFSGGKDSTVLLAIARKLYPDIRACFCSTGLEYPEIQSFVKRHENIDIVRPTIRFDEVISQYGYPLIGKEVAEAIYYARRIRSAERERERRDGGVNLTAECPTSSVTHTHTHTHTAPTVAHHRRELHGRRTSIKQNGGDWKSEGADQTDATAESTEPG